MKVRQKQSIPINLRPGDSITLDYTDANGVKSEVMSRIVDREMHLTHAVIFDVESGDFEGAKDGIGGAFLEMEPSP